MKTERSEKAVEGHLRGWVILLLLAKERAHQYSALQARWWVCDSHSLNYKNLTFQKGLFFSSSEEVIGRMLGNVLSQPVTRQTFLKDFPYIHPGIFSMEKELMGSVCGYNPSAPQKSYPRPSLHPVGDLDFIIFLFYSSRFQISSLPQVFCGSAIALSLTYRK